MKFSIRERIRSFRYAFKGLYVLFSEEPNALIHLAATVLVVVAGLVLKLTAYEWLTVILVIGLVFVTEILNSVAERLCDLYSTEQNEKIGRIKDLSAAAVLVSAGIAVVVALIIFIPKLIH